MKLLEAIRDRLVQRSLIGKRKLDRSAMRRELDGLLRELGERYRALARAGRIEVPEPLAATMEAVKDLEQRIEERDREIAALEDEAPSTT